jgi:hypothetical protein
MNRRNRISVLLSALAVLVFIGPAIVSAQPCKLMGGANTDMAAAIVRASSPSNGYILAGKTTSFGPGIPTYTNGMVIRVSAYGTPINAIVTNGNNHEEVTSMVRLNEGGYAATGWTRSHNAAGTNADIFVMKLNATLGLVWGYAYHLPAPDRDHMGYSIIEASGAMGGGFVVTGWMSTTGTDRRFFVLRLTSAGAVSWAAYYTFPGYAYDEGYSVCEASVAGANVKLGVVGSVRASATSQANAIVLRLTSTGAVVGAQILPGASDDQARSIVFDGSGLQPGLVVAGWTKSYGNGTPTYANIFVAKLNAGTGATFWSNAYHWLPGSTERDEYLYGDKALVVTSGALGTGYALCGNTFSRGPNTPSYRNILLVKLTYAGAIGWGGLVTIHPSTAVDNYSDEAWGLVQTSAIPTLPAPGDGIALTGWTNSFAPGPALAGSNFHFATFNTAGQRPAGCALQDQMYRQACAWTTQPPTRTAVDMSRTNITIAQCGPNSKEVCGGTFQGFAPNPATMAEGDVELRPENLRIVPNPVTGSAQVSFSVAQAGRVSLALYDVSGREVRALATGHLEAGEHSLRLAAPGLVRGIYILKLETGTEVFTQKVILE